MYRVGCRANCSQNLRDSIFSFPRCSQISATAQSVGQEVKQRRWWSPQASGIWCIAIFEVSHAEPACSDNCSRLRLNCDGTHAETRFRLSAKRTSSFKSAEASVQSTTGSRGVRNNGSNAGYTMFRGSVKSTGYPFHSPVSPSLPLPAAPCTITFQLDSSTIMTNMGNRWNDTRPLARPWTQWLQRLPLHMQYTHICILRSITVKQALYRPG